MIAFPVSIRLLGVILVMHLASCGDAPSATHPPDGRVRDAASVAAPPRRYNWATAAGGPGCAPKLRAMMQWYETQTENFRQADFISGAGAADGPLPPTGPFSVNEEVADSYLATLRGSGYFSPRYLAALRARAQTTARALDRQQLPKDKMPNMVDFPLFPRNYDDMMEHKGTFVFTAERNGRVITLNDGFTLMRFAFDDACKIDTVSSKEAP